MVVTRRQALLAGLGIVAGAGVAKSQSPHRIVRMVSPEYHSHWHRMCDELREDGFRLPQTGDSNEPEFRSRLRNARLPHVAVTSPLWRVEDIRIDLCKQEQAFQWYRTVASRVEF